MANVRYVSPDYFDAIGTPILRGRTFDVRDLDAADGVVIVDQSVVERYWPGEDGIGKRVRHGGDPADNPWLTIVGVVPNVKHAGLDEPPSLQMYELFGTRVPWTMLIDERLRGGGSAAGDGSRELARVLRRATAEHRDARYQSVAALRDDLVAALRVMHGVEDAAPGAPSAPSPS